MPGIPRPVWTPRDPEDEQTLAALAAAADAADAADEALWKAARAARARGVPVGCQKSAWSCDLGRCASAGPAA
ncbi:MULTISPECIES: hypothetical protein [unclassified Parafrankia]|uniref:hypothetical protein n=1 Tax=unclassified Parafrankia TaxID=2994368 RepID=UPI00135819CB|nr:MULTISPECIES: hypothetical protein [unclassified Parafrankia]